MFYSVVLVSAVQQSESAIRIHISPYPHPLASPSHPPYPTPLGGHKAPELISLCYAMLPTSYFTFGSVYMSVPLSQFVPAYTPPSLCPQVHSLHLCLYFCPAPRFFRTIFLKYIFHIYVLAYGICFSASDLLHSVWTDSRSIHLTTNNSVLFLFMAE